MSQSRKVPCAVFAALLVSAAAVRAQEDHSQHMHGGESLGTVKFPVSCKAELQPAFTRAVALLHSFGYEESRAAFADVAAKDPECGMATGATPTTYYPPTWPPPTPPRPAAGRAAAEKPP